METRGLTPLFIRTNENKMLNTFVIIRLTRRGKDAANRGGRRKREEEEETPRGMGQRNGEEDARSR